MLDTSPYNKNITEDKFLRIVKSIKSNNYKLIRDREYFFIWQKIKNKKPISDYIVRGL